MPNLKQGQKHKILKSSKMYLQKGLDTDHFNQCTEFSVSKKADEIVQEFCSEHPELKKYFQKRLLKRLLVSRQETAFAHTINAYLEEMDPSLNY